MGAADQVLQVCFASSLGKVNDFGFIRAPRPPPPKRRWFAILVILVARVQVVLFDDLDGAAPLGLTCIGRSEGDV